MSNPAPTTPDEALGLRALPALLDGNLDRAADILATARLGYRVAFLCRLAVVFPVVALKLGWWLAVRC